MDAELVIFDANGTLFDDVDIFYRALNRIFPDFGHEKLDPDTLRERFGQPWTKIYRSEGITEDDASRSDLYRRYNHHYQSLGPPPLSDGADEVLRALKTAGIERAIVSSQKNDVTIPALKTNDVREYFATIIGGSSDKSESIASVLDDHNKQPSRAIYIGDQKKDIEHARQAGVIDVAYLNGVHDRDDLIAMNPSFAIDNMRELISDNLLGIKPDT